MTMRDRFCDEAAVGLVVVLGEPRVLEVDSEGEARTSFEAPPPTADEAGPPCWAAEDASCEAREDSSWVGGGCCPAKGAAVDEAADDLRLPTRRDEADGSEGKLAEAGE
jgi:hypothetical protein